MSRFNIRPINRRMSLEFERHITSLGLPDSSLGELATLVERLACIQQRTNVELGDLQHIVFCSDHGVYERSHASQISELTTEDHVNRLLLGKSPLAKACHMQNVELTAVNCGLNRCTLDPYDNLVFSDLQSGSRDFSMMPAMTEDEFERALDIGAQQAKMVLATGANIVSFGILGLGNTTSAAAMTAALLNLPVDLCVKNQNKFDQQLIVDKTRVLTQALSLHREQLTDGYRIARYLGGFDIVATMGAMAMTAELNGLFMVDGYGCSAALLAITKEYPDILDYAQFSHQSVHIGQIEIMKHCRMRPLLSLGLALGEGTGSVFSWPLIQTAIECLRID